MSGALKPYPKYKESGVEWLGPVPEGWEVTKPKWNANIRSGVAPPHVESFSDTDGNIYPVVGGNGKMGYSTVFNQEGNAIVIGRVGAHCGNVRLNTDRIWVTDNALILTLEPSIFDSRFMVWLLESRNLNVLASRNAQPLIVGSQIVDQRLPLPPLPEQHAIADYLDTETQRIDTLIAELREMIRLLKEKRQALISHCVTKGLDPNVPMKDSGVEWLGEVPEGWEVIPLKHVMESEDSVRTPISAAERADFEKVFPYYGASGIIDYVDDYLFDQPRLLVAEDGANLLSRSTPLAFIATGKYWVNNHAHILKPTGIGLRLAQAFLASVVLDPWITGAAQPKLTSEALGTIPIPVPPIEEQKVIESHLDTETAKIDRLISETEDTITLMQERRSALISSVVTGKLQVPGVPQPSGSTLSSHPKDLSRN
jgi:type I restriction enzyme S subunit